MLTVCNFPKTTQSFGLQLTCMAFFEILTSFQHVQSDFLMHISHRCKLFNKNHAAIVTL